MRILYFHQHFVTPRGSGGIRSYEFAQRLLARGHQVTMVCGSYVHSGVDLEGGSWKRVRRGFIDGIEVIEQRLPYSNYFGYLKRSVVFLLYALGSIGEVVFREYDLVFATSTPLTAGIPGIAAKWIRGKPFVFEVRDLWPDLPLAMGVIRSPLVFGALKLLEHLSYSAADAGVGLSPGMVDKMKERMAFRKRILMISNACDLELFRPLHGSGPASESEIGSGFKAIFTGTHGTANELGAVLDAATVLKARLRGDIRILFVGDGSQKPGLVKRAKREGLDNCTFLDPMPKEALAKYMQQVHVGLMVLKNVPAFYYGTSPNKFFDFLASGIPVLNNYPGWLAEMIKEHRCGIAVPPEAPEAFADALEHLADHLEERSAMGRNARALAEAKFSRSELAAQFSELLEAVYEQYISGNRDSQI